MAFSVQMPALGESVTEGTVTRWLKQEGDRVEVDEPLLEVSTDKVDTEIPSPAAGVLQRIVAGEDETVEVGGELAVIGDGDGVGRRGGRAGRAPTAGRRRAGRHRTDGRADSRRKPRPRPRTRPSRRSTRPSTRTRPRSRPRLGVRRRDGRRRVGQAESGQAEGRRGSGTPVTMPELGRERHRGHRHPLAQAGRRLSRGRRAAARGVHRQGRHRDPLAGRGHPAGDHGGRGRDRRGRRPSSR